METIESFVRHENIALYKKLLSDTKITKTQREVIGKLLAEEECAAKRPWPRASTRARQP